MSALWEQHARHDPLWAVLADPGQKGRRWDLRRFFETGRREISLVLQRVDDLGVALPRRHALDFGCGVGRLTQALGGYFTEATGIDISPTMVRLAEKMNRHPDTVRYILNSDDNLEILSGGSFDFIYSNIVLHHIPPEAAVRYLRDFLRLLTADAVCVFQLPSHQRPPSERPRPPVPMPDEAYQARLEITRGMRTSMRASEAADVVVAVTNASAHTWSREEHGPIRIGNHWLTEDGAEMLVQDDARAELPDVIRPGEIQPATLSITAPGPAGRYVCEIDVVHEGVTWFRDRGSPPLQVDLVVGEALLKLRAGSLRYDEPDTYPDLYADLQPDGEPEPFPMFGVPRSLVEDVLVDAGGEIMLAECDEHGGPEWVGYRYFVRKR